MTHKIRSPRNGKKFKNSILMCFAVALIQGCGGGAESNSNLDLNAKEGYWELQDVNDNNSVYLRCFLSAAMCLDNDHDSYRGSGASSSFTATGSGFEDLIYFNLLFSDNTAKQDLQFDIPMGSSLETSQEFSLNNKTLIAVYDPAGIHESTTINASDFINRTFVDAQNPAYTFTVDGSGVFTWDHPSSSFDNWCLTGSLPSSSSVNFAIVTNVSSCGGNSLDTRIFISTNVSKTELIIGASELDFTVFR